MAAKISKDELEELREAFEKVGKWVSCSAGSASKLCLPRICHGKGHSQLPHIISFILKTNCEMFAVEMFNKVLVNCFGMCYHDGFVTSQGQSR